MDRITAPLLVVHGAYDTNVPIVEAEQIVEALRDRGASPGFLLFDDEGHEVHSIANRVLFVREVVRVGHRAPAGRGRADGLSAQAGGQWLNDSMTCRPFCVPTTNGSSRG